MRTRPYRLCAEEWPPLDGAYQNRSYGRRLGLARVRELWRRTLARGGAELSLYAHWPFCRERCAYCYCDSRVARGRAEALRHLESLLAEADALADLFAGLRFSRLLVGGGTPTAAPPALLRRLLARLRDRFRPAYGSDFAVEASAASLTPRVARLLAEAGVTRVDLGVDSLDPRLLAAAGRKQSPADAARAFAAAATHGLSVDASLLCGLPGQAPRSFFADLRALLRLSPARVRLYAFDPRPQAPWSRRPRDGAERRRALLALAGKDLSAHGYALPRGGPPASRGGTRAENDRAAPAGGPELPTSVLGLGWSARSRCHAAAWYQHPPLGRARPVRAGIPPFFGGPLAPPPARAVLRAPEYFCQVWSRG